MPVAARRPGRAQGGLEPSAALESEAAGSPVRRAACSLAHGPSPAEGLQSNPEPSGSNFNLSRLQLFHF